MYVYIYHVLYIFRRVFNLALQSISSIYSADQLKKYGICTESAFYQALGIALCIAFRPFSIPLTGPE